MVHFYETSRASVAVISQAAWPEKRGLPVVPLKSACRLSFRFLTRSAFIGSNLPTRAHYFRVVRYSGGSGVRRANKGSESCRRYHAQRSNGVRAILSSKRQQNENSTIIRSAMLLAARTRLGPYEILALLGAGGMGEVYRATDTRLNRDVAIKVLPEALARDAERMARFEREAKVLASLNHPNVASIYGLEESNGDRAPKKNYRIRPR